MITDHIALTWLHNLRTPTRHLARWALELLEYDYENLCGKRCLNYAPDALSRTSVKLDSVSSMLSTVGEKEKEKLNEVKYDWY